jgi:hypothetical protein
MGTERKMSEIDPFVRRMRAALPGKVCRCYRGDVMPADSRLAGWELLCCSDCREREEMVAELAGGKGFDIQGAFAYSLVPIRLTEGIGIIVTALALHDDELIRDANQKILEREARNMSFARGMGSHRWSPRSSMLRRTVLTANARREPAARTSAKGKWNPIGEPRGDEAHWFQIIVAFQWATIALSTFPLWLRPRRRSVK